MICDSTKTWHSPAVSLAVLTDTMNFWGTNSLQTILLQRLMDYTPAQAGYADLAWRPGDGVDDPWAGRLADKIDRRYVVLGWIDDVRWPRTGFPSSRLSTLDGLGIWMIAGRYITIGSFSRPVNAASMMLLLPDKVRMGAGLVTLCSRASAGLWVWP